MTKLQLQHSSLFICFLPYDVHEHSMFTQTTVVVRQHFTKSGLKIKCSVWANSYLTVLNSNKPTINKPEIVKTLICGVFGVWLHALPSTEMCYKVSFSSWVQNLNKLNLLKEVLALKVVFCFFWQEISEEITNTFRLEVDCFFLPHFTWDGYLIFIYSYISSENVLVAGEKASHREWLQANPPTKDNKTAIIYKISCIEKLKFTLRQ